MKKHIYKSGSPGWERARAGITLTSIKRMIKSGEQTRKHFRNLGWLS